TLDLVTQFNAMKNECKAFEKKCKDMKKRRREWETQRKALQEVLEAVNKKTDIMMMGQLEKGKGIRQPLPRF
ncbi:hypothetical protein HK102_006677, partial [Quaeritorhiza haematococci]